MITGADTATAAGADTDVSDEPVDASASSLLPAGASVGANESKDACEGVPTSGVLTPAVDDGAASPRWRLGFGRDGVPAPGADESPMFSAEPVPGKFEPPRDRRPDSTVPAELAPSETPDLDRGPRCGPRPPDGVEADSADADESSRELAEPVVSANAAGPDTTAELTPSATAKAPTRPT